MKSLALLALALTPVAAFPAGLTSAFDFSGTLDPYLDNGHSGALSHRNGGASPGPAGSTTYSMATVGSTMKQVLNFAKRDTLFALHGIGANDAHNNGGAYANNYTIVMDVKFDAQASGSYSSLFNTNAANDNDGDSFLLWGSGDTATVGIQGSYGGNVSANAWHRIAIAVDIFPDGTELTYYSDGLQAHKQVNRPAGEPTDGRFALYSYDDNDAASDGVFILGDEDGDNGSGQISLLAFYGETLDAATIQGLGGAGQPVPEPGSMVALGIGACALIQRRRK